MKNHNECRCCNDPIHNSEGRVYCVDTKCKEIFIEVKERIRKQNKEFWKIMNLKCTTCRKRLVEGEDKYCSVCVARSEAVKKRNAETDFYRPCETCKAPMKNPAPNRKRCEECAEAERDEKIKVHNIKRKVKRDAIREKSTKQKRQRAADPTDINKGGIDPKWLKPMGSKRRTI